MSDIREGDALLRRRLVMRVGREAGTERTDMAGDKGGLAGAESMGIEMGGDKARSKEGGGSLHDRGEGHVVVQVVVEVEDGREGDGFNKRTQDPIPHVVANVDMRR